MSLRFFEEDVPENINEWLDILTELTGNKSTDPIDAAVWSKIKKEEEIPHVGNFYIDEVLQRLREAAQDSYPHLKLDINWYANAVNSHLCLNGFDILHKQDFFSNIKKAHIDNGDYYCKDCGSYSCAFELVNNENENAPSSSDDDCINCPNCGSNKTLETSTFNIDGTLWKV